MNAEPITVAIIDNAPVDRHGLIAAVASAADLRLLCAVASVAEFERELLLGATPDAVLLDLALGGGIEGIEAVAHLSRRGLAVVVVSSHFREASVRDSLDAGARGILPKSASFGEITRAVRTAAAGRVHYSPQVAAIQLRGYNFSPHERRILELVAQGATDTEIAADLHLSKDAVTGHLDRIAPKAGARKRTRLAQLFYWHFRPPRDDPPIPP
jgi:DNA-binding NarL/FixJ family response regulator